VLEYGFPFAPGQPIIEPLILTGLLTIERIHVQMVLEFPQALPAKAHILQPEAPAGGNEV
jgi:hypothetical protein